MCNTVKFLYWNGPSFGKQSISRALVKENDPFLETGLDVWLNLVLSVWVLLIDYLK